MLPYSLILTRAKRAKAWRKAIIKDDKIRKRYNLITSTHMRFYMPRTLPITRQWMIERVK